MLTLPKNICKVLVIEDNPGDLFLVKEYLEESPGLYDVSSTKNFKTARAVLNQEKRVVDVVLLDLSLPDKSGEELIHEINILACGAPVIVLTGYSNMAFILKSLDMGVSDYLIKDELSATILHKSILYCIQRKKIISRIEESEKRYSDLFNLSSQPILIYDAVSLRFTKVNAAATALYGYSEDEFLLLTFPDLTPQEELTIKENETKAIDLIENIVHNFSKHCTKNGAYIDVKYSTFPIKLNGGHPHTAIVVSDITQIMDFEKKISEAIIKSQEEERYIIGLELHDNVSQLLAACKLKMCNIKSTNPNIDQGEMDDCIEYIKDSSDIIRNLSHKLAPAFYEDTTITESLTETIDSLKADKNLIVHFEADPSVEDLNLNRDTMLHLFRISQEHSNNILKYAKATRVDFTLHLENGNLVMKISDNGVGFEQKKRVSGIGFANILRRTEYLQGVMNITSSPGNGCILTIRIPVKEKNINLIE